jgi:hypothetical protein
MTPSVVMDGLPANVVTPAFTELGRSLAALEGRGVVPDVEEPVSTDALGET